MKRPDPSVDLSGVFTNVSLCPTLAAISGAHKPTLNLYVFACNG